MVHFGKKAAVLTAAGVLAATAVTGCSGSINTDAVVATVGDDEITLGVANFYARMTQGQYETYYASMMGTTGDAMWTQEAGEDQTYEESVKDGLLENLENMYLISQHAADYEVSLTEEEEDAIAEAAAQFDEDNTDEAKETVSGYRKDIEEFLRLATIQTKMDSKMREGVDEEVSDEEAAQKAMQYVFFSYTTTDDSGNTTELTDEEKESLKTDAQSLVDRVNAGEDISTVAEELGQTAYDLTFDSESTSPNEDLIAAVDAFETEGQVTDVIEADDGLYVGRLTSLLDRDATDQKKTSIVEERRQEQYDSLLEEWRNDTDIKVDEKVWDKVDFEDTGVTIITSETEETTTDDGSTDDTSEGSSESADDSSEDASASEDSASE
ncbi:peptidyl-prolyl cis-trans isomerase [Mediterraneibacter glycyrrhizinilyticus]|uniref:peptidyl-prolyl cis-trans isomerase n=1 Tax=Mediterraneibacter glycyrrhizinilyticus TaxID=342942 RepID=UPI00195FFB6C|nr:peptidyl-prolyl cis-trans isomerase [Mediterraneibacter glycyrrhizinilyticus]MBM6801820.1 peptidyl-prolyl cis-trans isomerase [Mediterraneibacter glycyrrhizinilyticus]MDM8125626.1 peptidyl-prolyl cis-trans isomerase [Mediterraneibacter glycyrrhizinilyticus]